MVNKTSVLVYTLQNKGYAIIKIEIVLVYTLQNKGYAIIKIEIIVQHKYDCICCTV